MQDAISAIGFLYQSYKTVKDIIDQTSNLELKQKIVDMGIQILDLKESIHGYRNKIDILEEEIKRIKYLSEKELEFKNGAYFSKDEDSAICPNCWDNNRQYTRMRYDSIEQDRFRFPNCRYMTD